ncbi:hypothetical protein [Kitasatospora sp. NPDC088779]|uniref:hypothetical protein n=1 Tax=unclassified Kitasatospora TaxID=2633591 RepID=UPI0034332611
MPDYYSGLDRGERNELRGLTDRLFATGIQATFSQLTQPQADAHVWLTAPGIRPPHA